MYPEGTLIDSKDKTLVVFEKDLYNPENEGFICFWEVKKANEKKLIFKKRLTKEKAIDKYENLLNDGWKSNNKTFNSNLFNLVY
tara:strand:+ start:187 stop:438 length:252 start_codon:yes stop_codon:yes gene_type:complete